MKKVDFSEVEEGGRFIMLPIQPHYSNHVMTKIADSSPNAIADNGSYWCLPPDTQVSVIKEQEDA